MTPQPTDDQLRRELRELRAQVRRNRKEVDKLGRGLDTILARIATIERMLANHRHVIR